MISICSYQRIFAPNRRRVYFYLKNVIACECSFIDIGIIFDYLFINRLILLLFFLFVFFLSFWFFLLFFILFIATTFLFFLLISIGLLFLFLRLDFLFRIIHCILFGHISDKRKY